MTQLRKDELVVLLGAGASVDAGIPHSRDMANQIERLVSDEWREFRNLYNYIKSSALFADGLIGKFDTSATFNIERIVNTLQELSKKEVHPLYPFVGSWNPKLLEVAGPDFDRLPAFRHKILERLRDNWLPLEPRAHADYYKGLLDLQEQYEHPLRIFTLNYDLCVENCCPEEDLERGFDNRKWDWRRFELEDKRLYLYKLHGSTDWVREAEILTYKDNPTQIPHDMAEIIFGTSYKLQYIDPFLFFVYEFRKWTLSNPRLILLIGYGFADEHINGILAQALNNSEDGILLSVAPLHDSLSPEKREKEIEALLGVRDLSRGRVKCWDHSARDFMSTKMDLKSIVDQLLPQEKELFTVLAAPGIDATASASIRNAKA